MASSSVSGLRIATGVGGTDRAPNGAPAAFMGIQKCFSGAAAPLRGSIHSISPDTRAEAARWDPVVDSEQPVTDSASAVRTVFRAV